jgi:hypothetical protein
VQQRLFLGAGRIDDWRRRKYKCLRMLRSLYCGVHQQLHPEVAEANNAIGEYLLNASWPQRGSAFAIFESLLPASTAPLFWLDDCRPPNYVGSFDGDLCRAVSKILALSTSSKLKLQSYLERNARAAASASSSEHRGHWEHYLLAPLAPPPGSCPPDIEDSPTSASTLKWLYNSSAWEDPPLPENSLSSKSLQCVPAYKINLSEVEAANTPGASPTRPSLGGLKLGPLHTLGGNALVEAYG